MCKTCPPGFQLNEKNQCISRNLYQQYKSLENKGVGGLKTALPKVRDGFSPQQIDLGRYLFFDPVLSANGTVSCASCHNPDLGFSDAKASKDPDSDPNPDRVVILDNFMINNGNNPVGEIRALMLTKLSTKGPDILVIGGGQGSSIRNESRYRTWGLGDFGVPIIKDTKSTNSFLLDEPVKPKEFTSNE